MDIDSLFDCNDYGVTPGTCLSSYVDHGTVESHRYYLSRRTVLEMLRDRGYSVPDSEIDISLQDFRSIYGDNPDVDRLRISTSLRTNPANKVLVVFCGPGVVKVNVIRSIAAQIMNKESLNRLILILQSPITNQALKAVDLFSFTVETFQITDLLVNITKHALKPKHQILTEKEKQNLLKKYSLEEKQLPRILQKDAIARYYGLEKGQVVKVTYSGEITESHVAYRIREILEIAGLAQESLSSNVASSAQVLANVANLLNIRDTELSSYLVAMADLSLRKTAVEENRSKAQKESKVLLDYTRKAISRLTYLKRTLAQLEDNVPSCEDQMEKWKTNVEVMTSKERQYLQQYANYKALLNRVGYSPDISHGVLVEMDEHRKELEKETKPILDTLRSYQDLPPDKALAALAIEDKKRQYAAAEKHLEDVLQSALST